MMETRSSLLRRVRNPADTAGWQEFVTLYEPLLLAYVRKKGLTEPDASDVVQEVLARLVKVLPDFELQREARSVPYLAVEGDLQRAGRLGPPKASLGPLRAAGSVGSRKRPGSMGSRGRRGAGD